MIRHASYDLLRVGLRIAVQLWPLWLFWFAWGLSSNMWLGYLQTFPGRSAAGYAIAYRAWPSVSLVGPILLMFAAILAYRMQLATRVMPIAGIGGVIVATAQPSRVNSRVDPPTCRPSGSATSGARPRCSATTVAQRVRTGARLT